MLQIRKPKKLGFFAMLLALLGIGGCTSEEIFYEREMMAMYGTPTANFSVKGTVTDEKGKPISNLQVILGQRYYNNSGVIYDVNYVPIDTLTTDAKGVYQMSKTRFPVQNLHVHVLYQGRIIKTAGPELALELEERGYDWVIKEYEDSLK